MAVHNFRPSLNDDKEAANLQLSVVDTDIKAALESLKPSDRAIKWSTFKENFDYIESALAKKVTKASILAALASKGLKLSANTFNKMLQAERKRRQQILGEPDEGPPSQTNEEGGAP